MCFGWLTNWLADWSRPLTPPSSTTTELPLPNPPKTNSQTRAGGFLSREKLAGLEALQRGLIWWAPWLVG